MKQADVRIGMEVYVTKAPGSKQKALWTVDGPHDWPCHWMISRIATVWGFSGRIHDHVHSRRLRCAN